MEPVC